MPTSKCPSNRVGIFLLFFHYYGSLLRLKITVYRIIGRATS